MATTVDHLAPGLTVRVLRDFSDLRGRRVPAGVRGLIEGLGLDLATMEITFDWVRDGQREQLRFGARRAEPGDRVPSNGRMREFFEVEVAVVPDEVISAVANTAPALHEAPAWSPARPDVSLAPYRGRQPPADTNLNELRVACDCDWRMHRPVMDIASQPAVHACLRCGTVTATRSIGDDGRFTGDAWQSHLVVALPAEVHAWLAGWPRVAQTEGSAVGSADVLRARWPMAHALVLHRATYLPSGARCGSVDELLVLEDRCRREQSLQGVGQRLCAAGVPALPPPRALPMAFALFAGVWQALQLHAGSDEGELLAHARSNGPASVIAAELLRQRADANEFMLALLRSDDRAGRSAGHAMALLHPRGDPMLAQAIIGILQGLSLTRSADVQDRVSGHGRIEALLVLVAELALGTPEMIAALVALQRRLARLDAQLVRALQAVLAELRGDPPMSNVRPGFLP